MQWLKPLKSVVRHYPDPPEPIPKPYGRYSGRCKRPPGQSRENGKGIMGMKIFGEGKHATDEEREHSIHFAVTESNLHCMTLGLESIAQMDDAIERVMRNVKNS